MTEKRILNEEKQTLPGQTARRLRPNAGGRASLHCTVLLAPKPLYLGDAKMTRSSKP